MSYFTWELQALVYKFSTLNLYSWSDIQWTFSSAWWALMNAEGEKANQFGNIVFSLEPKL